MTRHRTQPIPETITIVAKNLPKTLILYKCDASPYYYTRYFSSKSGKNKIHRKSTKTENLTTAKDFARKFYEDILLAERNYPFSDSKNRLYKVVWKKYIEEQTLRQSRNEVNPKYVKVKEIESRQILKFMGDIQIKKIDFKLIDSFLTDLSRRGRTPETLKKYKQNIQGVLKYALRENLIDRIPPFPTIKRKDQPRPWFSEDEYEKLRNTTKKCVKNKIKIRGNMITDEMRYFITFIVNTFLRPSDVKFLKNKNIQIVEKSNERYLRIQTENAKTSNRPVVSMEVAVPIYRDILNFHKKNKNPCDKDDYVFLPKHKNRDHAQRILQRLFKYILEQSELEFTSYGEKRTIYSLRHTAISFRILNGDVDLFTLSNNARTSVEMIQRFYASHLTPEMSVKKIQSFREK